MRLPGGARFDTALHALGLGVRGVNAIIASYLPEPVDRILEIINTVDNPGYLPNDESKRTYRELLAQLIESNLPNFDADQSAAEPSDQKQYERNANVPTLIAHSDNLAVQPMRDEKQFDQNTVSTLRPTSTLFSPASQEQLSSNTPEASSLPVQPTRSMPEEENQACCCIL
jgi:hypothetical protein